MNPDEHVLSNLEKDIARNSSIIEELAMNFYGKNSSFHYGPTTCLVEISPVDGASLSSIKDSASKIASCFKVRPKSTRVYIEVDHVNVEFPREYPDELDFWDCLECQEAIDCTGLPLALGEDCYGNHIIEDLCECPHILIAGASGQGKSNCIRSMIDSILYFNQPDRIRFALIDSSNVELSAYKALHKGYLFGGSVANDDTQSLQMLGSLCEEIENRYETLSKAHCSNIKDYIKKGGELPYIALFVDEFADLFLGKHGKEYRSLILDIARKGRAAGVHCVIATQRSCADVISGAIKASFPYRIAFRVSNRVDSMAILDTVGAEKLFCKGDMLVMKDFEIKRIQGGLEKMEDTERLVTFANIRISAPYIE